MSIDLVNQEKTGRMRLLATRLETLLGTDRSRSTPRLLRELDDSARPGSLFKGLPPLLRERLAILALRAAWRQHMVDADRTWQLLDGLDGVLPERLQSELADARKLCARQQAYVLEKVNAMDSIDWPRVILWRRRLRTLAPKHTTNQTRLVEALFYSERDAEAVAMIDAADKPMAAALSAALGNFATVLPALRHSDAHIYRTAAPAYLRRGLPVIPAFGKRPIHGDWRDYQSVLPDDAKVAEWGRLGHAQIALLLGPASNITILEIDAREPELAGLIMRAAPPSPWRRRGQYGEARAYRGSTLQKVYVQTTDGVTAFETRSDGETLMLPPSIHCGTGQPYTATCHLADVLDDLPPLPADFADRIMRDAADAGYVLSRRT